MNEFLQSYGIWIVVGLFFLLMIFGRRGHGMGCGMGCGGHEQEPKKAEENKGRQQQEEKHSSGCH